MPPSRRATAEAEETEVTSEAEAQLDDAPYYCPGCGLKYDYPRQCTGRPESPHPPIEVVSTDELSGDPSKFTAAPSTENLG